MERPLTEEIARIEQGYQAALWKLDLVRAGVRSLGQYQHWLAQQPTHTQLNAERTRTLAATFLQDVHPKEAGTLRTLRLNALLREDTAVLYGLSVVLGEAPMPRHPQLVEHINWVATFVDRA